MPEAIARAGALACALTLLAAARLAAASPPVAPDLLQNLHWRAIGPFRGGRVLAVAAAPDNPARFYFGAVNGGVWQTDDAGRTWRPIFDQAGIGSIGALAIAPSAPSVLYAGTGEADMRSDIAQGTGLYRSADGGAHWVRSGLADTQQIGKILVDPHDPNTLLVAALGHPYGPNDQRGVFRSTDGGRTWQRTLFHDRDTGAIDLAAQPGNPATVYAALWQTRRPPWNVYPPSNGPGSGLYKSTDGGVTWTQLTGHGLPDAPGRIGIATSNAAPNRVYALISAADPASGQGGLYRSDDAGANFTRVSTDRRITERGWYFSGITADPTNADSVYVCDTIILHSADGGKTFVPLKGDPTGDDFHTLVIDPANPDRRILGVDQGAIISLNGGRSWSSWYNQPTGQFYHVATDNRFPYRVYGAQQDTGAAAVDSRNDSSFDGIGLMQFHESAAGGESDNIAPDPADPDTVYGGRVDRLDLKSGQMQGLDPTLAFPGQYRGTWTLPLVWGPRDHALYFANQRLFRTGDGGAHWTVISPDLSRPDPGVPPTLDPATAADLPTGKPGAGPRRGVIYSIAPSPLERGLIWAGTDDGLVWRTTDGGAHWTDVTPTSLTPWSKIGVIEASHADPRTAYIAVDRHRLDDQAPYLYRTRDGGKTWTPIISGLPGAGAPQGGPNSVNVIREDPANPALLFAGTESGAYVSFNGGEVWQKLQAGLPPTSVRDIVIHGNDLVIATHGRGFYVLDDILQLRALAAAAAPGPRLFPLADAMRVHPPEFTGTPMPRDEPMAPNPPSGLIIDYTLPPGATSVGIAIYDTNGALVRRFSSTDPVPKLDLATLAVAPEWAVRPVVPAASPGAHRFVWDLRYPVPVALQKLDPPAEGLWAPPGRYTVVLTIDGHELRQPAQILPDPRLRLHPGDLDRQFDLARQIEAAQVACQAAIAAAAAQHRDHAALTVLADRLASLAQAVESADAAPTPDARAGFAQARQALAAIRRGG